MCLCQIEVCIYWTKLTGEGYNRSICKFVTLPLIANAQPWGMKSFKMLDKFSGEMSGLRIYSKFHQSNHVITC